MNKGFKQTFLQRDTHMASKHLKTCSTHQSLGNASQNHNEIPLHFDFTASRMAMIIKNWTITSFGENGELQELPHIAGGNVKQCNHCETVKL